METALKDTVGCLSDIDRITLKLMSKWFEVTKINTKCINHSETKLNYQMHITLMERKFVKLYGIKFLQNLMAAKPEM